MTRLALDIIASHKAAYLWNVAENYAALWYVPELMTEQDVARIRRHIAGFAQSTGISIDLYMVPRPWLLVKSTRLFQLGVLAISLVFLIALPLQLIRYRQPDPILWFGFTAASALHASVFLVAAINETKPRLMLGNWPFLVLLVILALAWASAGVTRWRRAAATMGAGGNAHSARVSQENRTTGRQGHTTAAIGARRPWSRPPTAGMRYHRDPRALPGPDKMDRRERLRKSTLL
jgi:hypothetical protein